MELTETLKQYALNTAATLHGSDRRLFMARTVQRLGSGGQRWAKQQLGWSRVTIRKGLHELTSGIRCLDAFCLRRRKRSDEHLPTLLDDIKTLVDGQCHTDPTFQTQWLYSRLSAATVRKQLIKQFGYRSCALPSAETIHCKMRQLGYHLTTVQKCKPQKRSSRRMPSSSI